MQELKSILQVFNTMENSIAEALNSPLLAKKTEIRKQYKLVEKEVELYHKMILKGSVDNYLADNFVKASKIFKDYQSILSKQLLIISDKEVKSKVSNSADKLFYVGKMLKENGEIQLSIQFFEKALKQAHKFESFDIASSAASALITLYAQLGNIKKLESAKINYTNYERLNSSFKHIKHLNAEMMAVFYNSMGSDKVKSTFSVEIANEILNELSKVPEKDRNAFFSFNQKYYAALLLKLYLKDDYISLLKLAYEAQEKLGAFKHISYDNIAFCDLWIVTSLYKLGRFEEGLKLIQTNRHLHKKDYERNFIVNQILDYKIFFLINKLDFITALKLIDSRTKSPDFKNLTPYYQEILQTYRAIAYWGAVTNLKLNIYPKSKTNEILNTNFKLYKFLNEVPILYKDKIGSNVILHIIQYIHHLNNEDYEILIQRADSLNTYRSRYLKGAINKRTYIFIGMLVKLERCNFSLEKVIKSTSVDFIKLKGNISLNERPYLEWEIIPYEKLWIYILNILKINELPEKDQNKYKFKNQFYHL